MGHSDLSPTVPRRGLVIFPADEPADADDAAPQAPARSEWWLVPAAIAVAALLVAIALAIR